MSSYYPYPSLWRRSFRKQTAYSSSMDNAITRNQARARMEAYSKVKTELDYAFRKIREWSGKGEGGIQLGFRCDDSIKDLVQEGVKAGLLQQGFEVEVFPLEKEGSFSLDIFWLRKADVKLNRLNDAMEAAGLIDSKEKE